MSTDLLPLESITHRIALLRGQEILLDADLAALYGVPTKVLVQAVKRNADRFPNDFMFQLVDEEWNALRSQFVTSNAGRGGRRYAPWSAYQNSGERRQVGCGRSAGTGVYG